MRILDLANIFAKRYSKPVKVVGIRSGEKVHESMINHTESLRTVERDGVFVIKPAYETTIYNEDVFDFNSSLDVLNIEELEKHLVSLGYLDKSVEDFKDTQVDLVRKVNQDTIRHMTK
jgi:FlaA1/EpsC-like NDP-sugar epimerase